MDWYSQYMLIERSGIRDFRLVHDKITRDLGHSRLRQRVISVFYSFSSTWLEPTE
jgi:hypothetical protein